MCIHIYTDTDIHKNHFYLHEDSHVHLQLHIYIPLSLHVHTCSTGVVAQQGRSCFFQVFPDAYNEPIQKRDLDMDVDVYVCMYLNGNSWVHLSVEKHHETNAIVSLKSIAVHFSISLLQRDMSPQVTGNLL